MPFCAMSCMYSAGVCLSFTGSPAAVTDCLCWYVNNIFIGVVGQSLNHNM